MSVNEGIYAFIGAFVGSVCGGVIGILNALRVIKQSRRVVPLPPAEPPESIAANLTSNNH